MQIIDFSRSHVNDAIHIAKSNYEEERILVPELPIFDSFPDITEFADNGLGVAAFTNNKMVGFLGCYKPRDNVFSTTYVKGTFSPIHANGSIQENRKEIYKRLYQAAAEKWVKAGILNHVIGLYAHDNAAISSLFEYGFGLRFIDAIRTMTKIKVTTLRDYNFKELNRIHWGKITQLRNELVDHLGKSPCFLKYPHDTEDGCIKTSIHRNSRIFCAEINDKPIAYIEVMDSGENFVCDDKEMKNICGAYCLPQHRGSGLYQILLNYTINTLKKEGYTRLGVDFESFNPTAQGFWLKYFTAYTNSLVRRIDEKILEDNGISQFI